MLESNNINTNQITTQKIDIKTELSVPSWKQFEFYKLGDFVIFENDLYASKLVHTGGGSFDELNFNKFEFEEEKIVFSNLKIFSPRVDYSGSSTIFNFISPVSSEEIHTNSVTEISLNSEGLFLNPAFWGNKYVCFEITFLIWNETLDDVEGFIVLEQENDYFTPSTFSTTFDDVGRQHFYAPFISGGNGNNAYAYPSIKQSLFHNIATGEPIYSVFTGNYRIRFELIEPSESIRVYNYQLSLNEC